MQLESCVCNRFGLGSIGSHATSINRFDGFLCVCVCLTWIQCSRVNYQSVKSRCIFKCFFLYICISRFEISGVQGGRVRPTYSGYQISVEVVFLDILGKQFLTDQLFSTFHRCSCRLIRAVLWSIVTCGCNSYKYTGKFCRILSHLIIITNVRMCSSTILPAIAHLTRKHRIRWADTTSSAWHLMCNRLRLLPPPSLRAIQKATMNFNALKMKAPATIAKQNI